MNIVGHALLPGAALFESEMNENHSNAAESQPDSDSMADSPVPLSDAKDGRIAGAPLSSAGKFAVTHMNGARRFNINGNDVGCTGIGLWTTGRAWAWKPGSAAAMPAQALIC